MNTPMAARQNRFRIGLKKLFLAVMILGCLLGLLGNQFRMQRQDQKFVRKLNSIDPHAKVYYDSCVWNEEGLDDPSSANYGPKYDQLAPLDQPSGPAWLRSWFGKHFFNRVETLSCSRFNVDIDGLPYSPTLKNIFLRSEQIVSVDGLSKFPNLTDVELFNCPQLNDCTDLANCQNLEVIRIKDCPKLESIGKLARLKKLKRVDFDDRNTYVDLSGFKGSQSLESIELRMPMKDLDWLCDMPKLREVEFSLPVSVDGMKNLDRLETLRVHSNLHQVAMNKKRGRSSLNELNRRAVGITGAWPDESRRNFGSAVQRACRVEVPVSFAIGSND